MSAMDVSESELREVAEVVVDAANGPSAADLARARDFLRAAELARQWLLATESEKPERLTPFRCFVLGYLAAIKDRT